MTETIRLWPGVDEDNDEYVGAVMPDGTKKTFVSRYGYVWEVQPNRDLHPVTWDSGHFLANGGLETLMGTLIRYFQTLRPDTKIVIGEPREGTDDQTL